MSVHVKKKHQVVEIFGALHYGLPHNPIVVLACKTPQIIIRDKFFCVVQVLLPQKLF